jgi:hypothetical protein
MQRLCDGRHSFWRIRRLWPSDRFQCFSLLGGGQLRMEWRQPISGDCGEISRKSAPDPGTSLMRAFSFGANKILQMNFCFDQVLLVIVKSVKFTTWRWIFQ